MTDEVPAPAPLEADQEVEQFEFPADYEPTNVVDEPIFDHLYPPHEAERSYLGALLWFDGANEFMYRSAVEPKHFNSGAYGTIYEAMIAVRDRGDRVSLISVAEELASVPLETLMWETTDRSPNPGWLDDFAEQILARARRSSVRDLSGALGTIAAETPGPELDSAVETSVATILNGPGVRNVTLAASTLADVAFTPSEEDAALPTPWPILNRAMEGFLGGSLYTLSGDTGSGKSAIALQLAAELSKHGTCLYFTMEMGAREQQQRLIAQQCGVSLRMVRAQRYPDEPVRRRVEKFVRHTPLRIAFDDRANLSVSEIRRVALGTEKLAAVVVDQLSLMDIGRAPGENLADAIARTTKGLKTMAMDLKIPIIMLSQLNREAARTGRPTRHHLYGSSAIANDAYVILILWRADRERMENLSLIIDKNRQGEEGELDLWWEGEFVRAVDPTA